MENHVLERLADLGMLKRATKCSESTCATMAARSLHPIGLQATSLTGEGGGNV